MVGLILVIALLSLTAITIITVSLPSASTRQNRETVDKAQALRNAIKAYVLSHGGIGGTNPPTLSALVTTDGVACVTANDPAVTSTYLLLQGWCGPYLQPIFQEDLSGILTDGWGTLFTYNAGSSIVTSCGPNRACGDADDLSFAP